MVKKDDNNPRQTAVAAATTTTTTLQSPIAMAMARWILISVLATVGAHVGENT
jgi:hypothetical protein